MAALLTDRLDEERHTVDAVYMRELAQQEALERLIALLQSEAAEDEYPTVPEYRWNDTLHRQARLRAARASYVLRTSDVMRRVGPGAWVRRNGS